MDDLTAYWQTTLRLDLEGFSDPKSAINLQVDRSGLQAGWQQRGRSRQERFRLTGDGDFRWVVGTTLRPYSAFLTSPEMADFAQLSAAIQAAFPHEPRYVPTTVNVPDSQAVDSGNYLLQAVAGALEEGGGVTQLLFVKGDAGAGKTTLLREIVAAQAERYVAGEDRYMFLLVNAQGRALSSLRDALAGELQDLRAGFVRDAVPALARRGVLVPIIDGFDELLGAAGYGDAFGSLQQFLRELDGQGVMIVSARSSFYDVEFLSKDTDRTGSGLYEVSPISLEPWSLQNVRDYLARVRKADQVTAADEQAIEGLAEDDRELLRKPFFASRFAEYVDAGASGIAPRSLLQFLIESYLRRETEKIVDRNLQPLLPLDGHRRFFEEAAEEMWHRENRRLRTADLRLLAELIAGEFNLTSDATGQVVTKITSTAGLRTATLGSEPEFSFEHEVYFDHFLTSALQRQRERGAFSPLVFASGILPDGVVHALVTPGREHALQWINLLRNPRGDGIRQDNLRRNAGQILAAAFSSAGEVRNVTIGPAHFVNVSFGQAHLSALTFVQCVFNNTDFSRVSFEGCEAVECFAERLVVSDETRFQIAGLVPGETLRSIVHVAQGATYDPAQIAEALRRLGANIATPIPATPRYSQEGAKTVALLKKVARKYERTTAISVQDENLSPIFRDRAWPSLERLLIAHSIVAEEFPQTRGRRNRFLRIRASIPELLRYEGEMNLPKTNIGAFWRDVRALGP